MATISQIRGLLLEEVLLKFLEFSGYKTILTPDLDDTLHRGHSGLEVKGRGCMHQIDAIADFQVAVPFSNPQRLLVEAKCYKEFKPIGVEFVRNSVGVLKDVSEYWVSQPGNNNTRYHYQFALFSTSGFTNNAELYAFAQDIYLFPLQKSSFFRPIITTISSISSSDFRATNPNSISIDLTIFRYLFRNFIHYENSYSEFPYRSNNFQQLFNSIRNISGVILGMVARQYPIILTPNPDFDILNLQSSYEVEMYGFYNNPDGWILKYRGDEIASFDIPTMIFKKYAEGGALRQNSALNMKSDYFSEIQSIVIQNGIPKVVTFRLDHGWMERLLREQMH